MNGEGTGEGPREHGGDLDRAIAVHGGAAADWIDLSTGINRVPYPLPALPAQAWTALPRRDALDALLAVAGRRFGLPPSARLVAAAGAQAIIQLCPGIAAPGRVDTAAPGRVGTAAPGRVGIVSPTYNEHAAAFRAAGWRVVEVAEPEAAAGLDAAVVVNPNNPDGRCWPPDALAALADRVGLLIVDESFVDVAPALSVAGRLADDGRRLVVLRSFGKFFGLAGVRLGFAAAPPALAEALSARLGPWAVSGPAIEIARRAYADDAWIETTRDALSTRAARLDAWGLAHGWSLVGGTALYRTYLTPDAQAAQADLARRRVWTRRFADRPRWLRLGIPADDREFERLSSSA